MFGHLLPRAFPRAAWPRLEIVDLGSGDGRLVFEASRARSFVLFFLSVWFERVDAMVGFTSWRLVEKRPTVLHGPLLRLLLGRFENRWADVGHGWVQVVVVGRETPDIRGWYVR